MHFVAIAGAFVAALPTFVSAQTKHNVVVGNNGTLSFDPPSVVAAVGDQVQFTFMSKNHSVWQSTFTAPCTPDPAPNSFASIFEPITADAGAFPVFTINVSSTTPIWFYCAQTIPLDHCAMGMVGAVNPTADKTLAQFKATAMGAGANGTTTTTSGNGTSTGTTTSGNGTTTGTTTGNGTSGGPSSNTTSGSPPAQTTSGAIQFGTNAILLTVISIIAGLTAL